MKNENIQIVESLFENPLSFLEFGAPQAHKNMIVIPILVRNHKYVEFISIKKAEELDLIEIVETNQVDKLEIINKCDQQVLIPFGMTVHGGKQDRTIWEPILLPIGGKQNIFNHSGEDLSQKWVVPAKCIEQSRWTYKEAHGFKSSNLRLNPNVAFESISAKGQGALWNEIQNYRTEMKYNMNIAPTQSYLEMTRMSEKKIENIAKNFTNVENQCGIAVFINNKFVGIEFYANPKAWKEMSNDIFQAFAIEALRFKTKSYTRADIEFQGKLIDLLKNLKLKFTSRDGVGLGKVVDFNSENNKWRGITLVHDGNIVQFYLVSKRGGSRYQAHRRNVQFQTEINQRYFT